MVLVAHQNLILCYTFVARIEKVSTLFRYLYVVFWESCLHWFVLQKFAHKGFVSCLSPFGRHGSSKFVLQTSHVWCPGNSAIKDGEFYKYPQNGHFFPITISLFLVIAKQFVFCCHLLEQGSKIWPHRFHAKRRHNVSSQIARLPTPPQTIKCRLSGGQMTLDARTSRRSVVFFVWKSNSHVFFPGFLLQYWFCRDGSSSPGRRQNIVKPCLPKTFAKLADLFMSSSNASLLKPNAWCIQFLDDLNDNLQPFLEPALLPVVARTITASIPPLVVPSLGVRSLFFNTAGIMDTSTSVDMKTRLDLHPFIAPMSLTDNTDVGTWLWLNMIVFQR